MLGRQDLREWGDHVGVTPTDTMQKYGELETVFPAIMHREHHYLVLSGGAEDGAYGAGLLTGWSATGTRPEFTMVTGISTGALIAPFAFLGPEYDSVLETIYTTLGSKDLYTQRNWLSLFNADALADTSPFEESIARFMNDQTLDAIAAEYHRGRQLFIGTTNLDAGRPVIWNVTRIAASGHPDAYPFIRSLFRASAALPGLFPPVYVPVRGPEGQVMDEMHVDGGVTAQLFFAPSDMDWSEVMRLLDVKGKPTLYLIRNSRVESRYQAIDPNLKSIAGRTIGTLIRTQGVGDIYRLMFLAERDQIQIKATWIPVNAVNDITIDEVFDTDYMQALYQFGQERALSGKVWFVVGSEFVGELDVDR
ncbi:patatin-like phospholipase family protein [Ferrimonas balearica]|uniref:patatin-like phospholipase family protein n=1 Tax=Ferrimonas balearica TaxID=44012 RepID=UPI001C99A9F9|nr:patatin-like phospholipase family protein [Ferrimonas balearica]MBY5920441.1 patatin-like phospholipase family protein [Ferrimonas balearica]MBY5996874.1 patatin-like phospholipase family protein [Ferrimonas balearica]